MTHAATLPEGTATISTGDLIGLAQLWAEQFRHFTTLAVAGAGGVLILLQAEVIRAEDRWWIALLLFIMAALFGTYGQIRVVDDATSGAPPGRRARLLRQLALAFLGAAGGAAISTLAQG